MSVWRQLLAWFGLSPGSGEKLSSLFLPQPERVVNHGKGETATLGASASGATGPLISSKDGDAVENIEQFLLLANRHEKATLRHKDRRGRWWLFQTDRNGNLTVMVACVEPSAQQELADFLAHRRMSISYPAGGCERAWLEDPEGQAEKFTGALRDAFLALRATAGLANGKPTPLMESLLYPGGDARFPRFTAQLHKIYRSSFLGAVTAFHLVSSESLRRHVVVLLTDEACQPPHPPHHSPQALAATMASEVGLSEDILILSPAMLWAECREGKPRYVRFLAAAEPIYDTPFLAALRAYDSHVQAVLDRIGDSCLLYLLQGDVLRGAPKEDGDLQAAVLINDLGSNMTKTANIQSNLQRRLEEDWQEASARIGSRFRLRLRVSLASDLGKDEKGDAIAALGGGVSLFSRIAPTAGRESTSAN